MIKMQKYYDREWFTSEEKEKICEKSECKCAHCGKFIYPHFGATIDHFIPLSIGGSNQMLNLIALCEDCNSDKDNDLYPMSYFPYLKPKYKKEIQQYVDSFILACDTSQRNHLLAYREYLDSCKVANPKVKKHYLTVDFKLKRATWKEFNKIYEYFIRYLKKHDLLDDEQVANINLLFWMQFGSVYYIERGNEISCLLPITVKHIKDGDEFVNIPQIYVFSNYTTNLSVGMVHRAIGLIGESLIKENNLKFLVMKVVLDNSDKMVSYLTYMFEQEASENYIDEFVEFLLFVGERNDDNIKATYTFFNKFPNITKQLEAFYKKYGEMEISWMIDGILSEEDVKNTELEIYCESEV